jgi:quinol monooxygenase YgiN
VVEKEELLASPFYADAVIPVAGFLDKPESSTSVRVVCITKIITRPGKRSQLITAIEDELPRIEEAVVSFLVLKLVDNEDTVFLWERYSSEKGMRRGQQAHDGHVRLMENIRPLIQSKTVNRYNEECGFIAK